MSDLTAVAEAPFDLLLREELPPFPPDLLAVLTRTQAQTAPAPSAPFAPYIGGTHDLLYAVLAAAVGLRPALQPMDVYRGLLAAEPRLKSLIPVQLAHQGRVQLGGGRTAHVSGVEDALTFLELFRGLRLRLAVGMAANRQDVEDLVEDWLYPFIGGKIERAPQVATAFREDIGAHFAKSADPRAAREACSDLLTKRFGMSRMLLPSTRGPAAGNSEE